MSNPTPRPTRSRISSPFVPANASVESSNTIAGSGGKPKTFLDRWVEPALPAPLPSFAEAGIERHGVVANMVPLGNLPSVKVVKSANSEIADPARRVTVIRKPGTSTSSTPKEPIMTPEPVIASSTTPMASSTTNTSPVRRRSVSIKGDDLEYTPKIPFQQAGTRKPFTPAPRPSTSGQTVFSLQSSPSTPTMSRQENILRPDGQQNERPVNLEKTDRVIEDAVQEAVDRRRWPTAYALRTLYDDHRSNIRIVRIIEAIYEQRASEEERREFLTLMKYKKKEGRKDNTGNYYFNGDGTDPSPRPTFPIMNAPPSTYVTPYKTPYAATPPKRRSSSDALVASEAAQYFNPPSAPASPNKERDAAHVSKKHKGNNFQASNMDMNSAVNMPNGNGTKMARNENGSLARERTNSVSSTSSLSSIDEQLLGGGDFTATGSPMETNHALAQHTNVAESDLNSHAHSQPQPMTHQGALGPKTYTFPTTSPPATLPSPSSSSINNTKQDAIIMPTALPTSPSARESQQPYFKPKKPYDKVTGDPYDENDNISKKRRKARAVTEGVLILESFERHRVSTPQEVESASDGGESIAVRASKRPKVRLLNNQANKRYNYDSEAESSPTLLEFRPDLAPGSTSISRAGTPNASGRPSRKTKTGTGPRVKTSPMKKKGGTAGIPRASGERNSPIGNGAVAHNQDDNDDYCSSCGGNGDLVCCDGCTRSFHFKCVDPPMIEGGALPDEWFCNDCISRRQPRTKDEDGIFGSLLSNLYRRNPSAFHLTKDIREYFVGVKTGTEGEYEEGGVQKSKNRAGYEEAMDYFRMKDTKGNTILCHSCHKAAAQPNRMIIPCSYCSLYWHLDCLDPPMAKEPPPGRLWKCPCHIDDLLAEVPGSLGPAHRFRRIKGASVIKPALSRGIQNNGHIEIENKASDDEDQGFYQQREYGHIYKLPEEGVKLDFISQVKCKYHGPGYAPNYPKFTPARAEAPVAPFNQRSIIEQQAALNMAQLVSQSPDGENAQRLINILLAQAPAPVIDLMAYPAATDMIEDPISKRDEPSLLALRALIDVKLAKLNAQAEFPAADEKADEDEKGDIEKKLEEERTNEITEKVIPKSDDDDVEMVL